MGFFPSYGCVNTTVWMQHMDTNKMHGKKKLDGNYTRMLCIVLNKSWKQHPTKEQLNGHLPLISKIIILRQTRHARHCWRTRVELMSDIILWTPIHRCSRVDRPARTYISFVWTLDVIWKDLSEAMGDRDW